MTHEELAELARAAGFTVDDYNCRGDTAALERLVLIVRREQRAHSVSVLKEHAKGCVEPANGWLKHAADILSSAPLQD
jgi:hypothetical protein